MDRNGRPSVARNVEYRYDSEKSDGKDPPRPERTFRDPDDDAKARTLDSLDPETKAEVVRIAADRARRIGRPLAPGEAVSPEVGQARTTLAIASMTLMAVEAQEFASENLTVTTLRDILRRQRPSLPS